MHQLLGVVIVDAVNLQKWVGLAEKVLHGQHRVKTGRAGALRLSDGTRLKLPLLLAPLQILITTSNSNVIAS